MRTSRRNFLSVAAGLPQSHPIDGKPCYIQTRVSTVEETPLPPFGFSCIEFRARQSSLRGHQVLPIQSEKESQYFESLCLKLGQGLWPEYSRESKEWVGTSRASSNRLTLDDLRLISELHHKLDAPVSGLSNFPAKHMQLYREEDGLCSTVPDCSPRPLFVTGKTFLEYAPRLHEDILKQLAQSFQDASILLAAREHCLRLKEVFQRPRPSQAAYLLGLKSFRFHWATTSVTPALPSGHAFQSLLAGAFAAIKLRRHLNKESLALWAKYIADIGDRRVFAGVHYPSDSIASWYFSLSLAHLYFPNDTSFAKDFIWMTILENSDVFSALRDSKKRQRDSHWQAFSWFLSTIR